MVLNLQVYKTRNGQWRWRMRGANNRIIGAATESYKTRAHCVGNMQVVTGLIVGPARYRTGNWQTKVDAQNRGWIGRNW